MSLGLRLVLSYLLTTLVAMSILATYNLVSFRDYAFTSMETELSRHGDALVTRVADGLDLGDRAALRDAVDYAKDERGYTVRIFDHEGSLVASSNPEEDVGVGDWRNVAGISDALESRPSRGRTRGVGAAGRGDRLYDARPIVRGGQVLGALRVSMSVERVERELDRRLSISIGALAITFALSLAVGLRFAHAISSPMRAMRSFARRLGGGTFGELLTVRRDDEIGELADELNAMSRRLAKVDEERRAFLANAAHEMRTPVSNVLVTLEALESGAHEDPALRQQFLGSALDETRRLARLVQDLLDLGRLDAGVVQLELQQVGLLALLGRAASAIRPRMRARGVEVRVEGDDVAVQVDPERLLQALMNILDNALKFSPDGGTVAISGRTEGQDASIEVRDAGPGIAGPDRAHLFEPFYTGDASRARGGAGLGLAMAMRIVRAHGGSITSSNLEGGGAAFSIRLPGAVARGAL